MKRPLSPEAQAAAARLRGVLAVGPPSPVDLDVAREIVRRQPDAAEAHALLAQALLMAGARTDAAASVEAALRLDKRNADALTVRALLHLRVAETVPAERALRAAIAADRSHGWSVTVLTNLLTKLDRFEEARRAAHALASTSDAPDGLLVEYGVALRMLGQPEEAAVWLRLVERHSRPWDMAWAADALERAGRDAEALDWASRVPPTDPAQETAAVVRARVLRRQGRLEEAEVALAPLVADAPMLDEPLRLYAELVWERTGDLAAALAPLEAAQAALPLSPAPRVIRAKLLEYADQPQAAYASLGPPPFASLDLDIVAAQAALGFDPALALRHARRAVQGAPDHPEARILLADALLATGQAEAALDAAEARLAIDRYDQHALGLKGSALRLLGAPEAAAFSDYASLVGEWTLDTPGGWSNLPAFLADLAGDLRGLHVGRGHHLGQSVRHGTQTTADLLNSGLPTLRGLFEALDGPIRRHLKALGEGRDPVRRRNSGRYRFAGAWSVQLRPGGRHANHHHPGGWLSSACYIEVPDAVDRDRAGWLQFGQPGVFAGAGLEPEHFVRPEPGKLVLFPSWMWHGTVPFGGEQPRLTVAFDLAPA